VLSESLISFLPVIFPTLGFVQINATKILSAHELEPTQISHSCLELGSPGQLPDLAGAILVNVPGICQGGLLAAARPAQGKPPPRARKKGSGNGRGARLD
jgi:hypothetical protein